MDAAYFTDRYRDLLARIEAVDLGTAEGRREIIRLFDEHGALYAELRGSALSDNIRLNVLDSRVFSELLHKMLGLFAA